MIARLQLESHNPTGGTYFGKPKTDIQFILSGCKPLDLALGGGWARKRVANIVGDKSSGKTLLCIEAAANFAIAEPKGKIRYRESESAFLPSYAEALGMPIDRVDFGSDPIDTVEDLFDDMTAVVAAAIKHRKPELYIVDSLDALSDRAEMKRGIDEGSYGANKAKQMSQLFRRMIQKLEKADVTVMIVSQVRDKIGVTYGRKTTRSGGKALDFYASQVVYLAQTDKIYKTIDKIKRPVGVSILANIDKNKIALPFRQAEFDLLFGYGVDDRKACKDWLAKHGSALKNGEKIKSTELRAMVERRWFEVERSFLPKRSKYGVNNGKES